MHWLTHAHTQKHTSSSLRDNFLLTDNAGDCPTPFLVLTTPTFPGDTVAVFFASSLAERVNTSLRALAPGEEGAEGSLMGDTAGGRLRKLTRTRLWGETFGRRTAGGWD